MKALLPLPSNNLQKVLTMENNEDNRQMTVLTEAIAEIKSRMFSRRDCNRSEFCRDFNDGYESVVELLESLLPKEQEHIVSAFNEGAKICAVANLTKKEGEKPYIPLYGDIHFNQTFKTT